MKLKKLAAGACALALGAAMMAMPASAASFAGNGTDSHDVTATGKTNHVYQIDISWPSLEYTYERTWHNDGNNAYYEYTTRSWESDTPDIVISNMSDLPIYYAVSSSATDGITITSTSNNTRGELDAALENSRPTAECMFKISGSPTSVASKTSEKITLGTFTVDISTTAL